MIRAVNALAFLIAAALAVALYLAKSEAQGAQERLTAIQSQLAEERRQINVLSVEIAHLEDLERLRHLARRYLGFEPLDPAREVTMADLPLLIEPGAPSETPRSEPQLANRGEDASVPRVVPAGGAH